jgi:hypothetical protein
MFDSKRRMPSINPRLAVFAAALLSAAADGTTCLSGPAGPDGGPDAGTCRQVAAGEHVVIQIPNGMCASEAICAIAAPVGSVAAKPRWVDVRGPTDGVLSLCDNGSGPKIAGDVVLPTDRPGEYITVRVEPVAMAAVDAGDWSASIVSAFIRDGQVPPTPSQAARGVVIPDLHVEPDGLAPAEITSVNWTLYVNCGLSSLDVSSCQGDLGVCITAPISPNSQAINGNLATLNTSLLDFHTPAIVVANVTSRNSGTRCVGKEISRNPQTAFPIVSGSPTDVSTPILLTHSNPTSIYGDLSNPQITDNAPANWTLEKKDGPAWVSLPITDVTGVGNDMPCTAADGVNIPKSYYLGKARICLMASSSTQYRVTLSVGSAVTMIELATAQ